jgi:hypothetical protein
MKTKRVIHFHTDENTFPISIFPPCTASCYMHPPPAATADPVAYPGVPAPLTLAHRRREVSDADKGGGGDGKKKPKGAWLKRGVL